jgi:ribonucleoside-diphosphate reductase alpha chain
MSKNNEGVFMDTMKENVLQTRAQASQQERLPSDTVLVTVTKRNGSTVVLDIDKVKTTIARAVQGFEDVVSTKLIMEEFLRNIYEGITTTDIEKALVLAAVAFIEKDPAYDAVAARLHLKKTYKEVFQFSIDEKTFDTTYRQTFVDSIKLGAKKEYFDKRLLDYDLEMLSNALLPENDSLFSYQGVQTLYSRYFLKIDRKVIETPQAFWMRIAMGLALLEENKNEHALSFYKTLSSLHYVSSTPTLFHSGLVHAQLSSCFLSTVDDDLGHIFKVIGDNAQLSKWAGGIGNDWTNIRGTGSWIKSIHAYSQGVVPFLKVANDVVVGITRSGIRRGGTCAYLESWHLDVEDFLDLRRNTGDERRRTHDMNTANWIPDLFMKRVIQDGEWTLFSPDEVPDLHGMYGAAFEKRYEQYEEMARKGEIKAYKVIVAKQLWRKMLSRLFETGHPWITFKDPCNVRSPQDHVGVVNSSNLCTEITLNTSATETAVCNLGSINLQRHIVNGQLDEKLVHQTVRNAIRMLDNVIELNFYPTKEARDSNMKHRPIGLGMMGFQDALFQLGINFSDEKALEFADMSGEMISYYAILTSSELAREKGRYASYEGSKWDRNLFPIDTIALLEKERGEKIDVSRTQRMDWTPVREHVKKWGMRNSNTMAVAPTATISNIVGCYPSIEPIYKNIYVKANVSGEFTIINKYLIDDLKELGLWSDHMLDQIKYYDGTLQMIQEIPDNLKEKYKTAFQLDPEWLIRITATRGKWIDQAQSHNVFMEGVSGKKLNDIYITSWKTGMKTNYYLRTLGASQIEKSTLDANKFGYTQKREYAEQENKKEEKVVQACNIMDDPSCESCQ